MASEIGVTSKGPTYMITTLRKAGVGEDGGVSLLGEFAAFIGSAIIGVMAFAFGMIDSLPLALFVSIVGGFLGTNLDSLLGAVFQKRGYLSNSGVNVFATLLGGLISFALYFLLF
jgi:Predicted membrane protein